MRYRKVYHPHVFSEDAVFACIMSDEYLCTKMLERIFPDKKVEKLKMVGVPKANKNVRDLIVDTQKELITGISEKRVRLDVLFYGEREWYNIEMQTSHEADLPRRSRYYASRLDAYQMKRGMDYRDMKNTYVIFICTYDPFGLGKAMYKFERYDVKNHLPMSDGTYTIVLNAKSKDENVNVGLKSLLRYVDKNEIDENDEFLKEIDKRVDTLNEDEEWGRALMTLEEKMNEAKEQARKTGLAEGRAKGRAEGRAEGRKTGERNKQLEIARKLKNMKLAITEIIEATGLTMEEIEKL